MVQARCDTDTAKNLKVKASLRYSNRIQSALANTYFIVNRVILKRMNLVMKALMLTSQLMKMMKMR